MERVVVGTWDVVAGTWMGSDGSSAEAIEGTLVDMTDCRSEGLVKSEY